MWDEKSLCKGCMEGVKPKQHVNVISEADYLDSSGPGLIQIIEGVGQVQTPRGTDAIYAEMMIIGRKVQYEVDCEALVDTGVPWLQENHG